MGSCGQDCWQLIDSYQCPAFNAQAQMEQIASNICGHISRVWMPLMHQVSSSEMQCDQAYEKLAIEGFTILTPYLDLFDLSILFPDLKIRNETI